MDYLNIMLISKDEKALEIAINLYLRIQKHSFDPSKQGLSRSFYPRLAAN